MIFDDSAVFYLTMAEKFDDGIADSTTQWQVGVLFNNVRHYVIFASAPVAEYAMQMCFSAREQHFIFSGTTMHQAAKSHNKLIIET